MPVYSYEEKALMAEILRDEQLNERKEKARNVDMKLHEAKLRRMFQATQAVAVRKERSVSVHIHVPYHILQTLSVRPYPSKTTLFFIYLKPRSHRACDCGATSRRLILFVTSWTIATIFPLLV